jgi:chorismate--pyruvate lyase
VSESGERLLAGRGWRDATAALCRRLPADAQHWLFDRCSLTARLQRACAADGGRFAVRVLSQRWQRPLPDERRILGLREHEYALIRQVYLVCAGERWVYARTIVPLASLRGRGRRLANLGSRPLGAMLFADRGVRRGRMQVARLTPGDYVFAQAVDGLMVIPDRIWGRRSLFHYAGRPLLVNEIFLPAVGRCQSGRHAA